MDSITNEELVRQIRETENEEDRKELLSCLYQRNYPLIKQICCRYVGGNDPEDLTQEAYFGLHTAVMKYDESMNVPFINYCMLWVKQSIFRYLENTKTAVRLPVHVRSDVVKYKKAVTAYQTEHGSDPSDRDIMISLGLNASQFEQIKRSMLFMTLASLNSPLSGVEDESITLEDDIPDPEAEEDFLSVMDEIDNDRKSDEIWSAVNALGEIPSEVIKRRFQNCETLKEIGADIHKTGEQVRQIQNKALKRLKFSPVIRCYQDEYSTAFRGSGLNNFRHSGTSSTEKLAIHKYEQQIERYRKQIERDMRTVKKKYDIELGTDLF